MKTFQLVLKKEDLALIDSLTKQNFVNLAPFPGEDEKIFRAKCYFLAAVSYINGEYANALFKAEEKRGGDTPVSLINLIDITKLRNEIL